MCVTKFIEIALVLLIKTLLRFGKNIWLVQSQLTKFAQNLQQLSWKPNQSEAAPQPNTTKTGLWMGDCVTATNHLNILSIWCKQRIRLFCCHMPCSNTSNDESSTWKRQNSMPHSWGTKSIYKIAKWIWALWFVCVCI